MFIDLHEHIACRRMCFLFTLPPTADCLDRQADANTGNSDLLLVHSFLKCFLLAILQFYHKFSWNQMTASSTPPHHALTSSCQKKKKKNREKEVTGWDKDREITHTLPHGQNRPNMGYTFICHQSLAIYISEKLEETQNIFLTSIVFYHFSSKSTEEQGMGAAVSRYAIQYMEHPFCQFGSTVPAASPPSSLCTSQPDHWQGSMRREAFCSM